MMFQYKPEKTSDKYNGYAELIFNWYGGNIVKRFDEFKVLGSAEFQFLKGYLYFGGNILLYHFKNEEFLAADGSNGDTYLLDRLYYNAYVGTSFLNIMPFMTKAYTQFGTLSSIERKRRLSTGLDPWYSGLGWQWDIGLQYKGFGVKNSYYFGKSQDRFFAEYGPNFYWGLPFYQASRYDRAQFYYEYKTSLLTARASIVMHFANNIVANQELLIITLDTGRFFRDLKRFFHKNLN